MRCLPALFSSMVLVTWPGFAVAQLNASASASSPFPGLFLPGQNSCSSTTNPAACSIGFFGGAQVSGGGSSSGSAAYGTLTAAAGTGVFVSHINSGGINAYLSSTGSASFADLLTIQNGPTSGELLLTLGYSEQTSISCGGTFSCQGTASLSIQNGQSTAMAWSGDTGINYQGPDITQSARGSLLEIVPFSASTASLLFSLTATSFCYEGIFCNSTSSASASVLSLQVADSNGNLINGASVIAASGTDYNTVVPLPASVWLMLSALGGLGVFSRKRLVLSRTRPYG
jgi:hypothetical protein